MRKQIHTAPVHPNHLHPALLRAPIPRLFVAIFLNFIPAACLLLLCYSLCDSLPLLFERNHPPRQISSKVVPVLLGNICIH